jgi:hypothetical protein
MAERRIQRFSTLELIRQAEEQKVLSGKAPAEVNLLDDSVFTPQQKKEREARTAEINRPFPEPWESADRARKLIKEENYEAARILLDNILASKQVRIWANYAVSDNYTPKEIQDYVAQRLR